MFSVLRERLKYKLRFWRADLPVAVVLLSLIAFAGLLGGFLFGLAGAVAGVLATFGAIQLLDMIP